MRMAALPTRRLIGLVLVAACVPIVCAAKPKLAKIRAEKLLLERAQFLASTKGWAEFVVTQGEYHWITNDTLLYFRRFDEGPIRVEQLNVRTGVVQALSGLTRAFNETHPYIADVSVSPDGRRLLWASVRDNKPTWVTAAIDGSNREEWRRLKVGSTSVLDPFAWSNASWTGGGAQVAETWLEPGPPGDQRPVAHATVRNVDDEPAERTLAKFAWTKTFFAPEPDETDPTTLLAYDDSITLQNRAADDVDLYSVKVSAGKPVVSWQRVHLPKYANFADLVISPKADRIAWELGSPYDPTSRGMMTAGGAFRRQRVPLGYWVSRRDGAGLHELGHLPLNSRLATWQHQRLGGLAWTPDGRFLSFVYNGKLYRIAAE